jgi:hypothetical protein
MCALLQILENESLKENKLKRHLASMHRTLEDKPPNSWKDKQEAVERMRLDVPCNPVTFSLGKASLASFVAS